MKIKLLIIAGLVLCLYSCSKGTNWDELDPRKDTKFAIEKELLQFTCGPTFCAIIDQTGFEDLISALGDELQGAPGTNTSLVLTDMSGLGQYGANYIKAYNNGAVIAVLNPNIDVLGDFLIANGLIHSLPVDCNDVIIYAFCKQGDYIMHKISEVMTGEPTTTPEEGAEAVMTYDEDDVVGGDVDKYSGINFSELGWYLGPFVKWVNEKASLSDAPVTPKLDEAAPPVRHHYTYNVDFFIHSVSKHSNDDRIKGPFSVFADYLYQPYYIYPNQDYTASGDFYYFVADYGCELNKIFYGNNFVNTHGGIKVHITGAFLRDLNVKTYIEGDGLPMFVAGFHPVPVTQEGSSTVSTTKENSVEAGISGNFGKANGEKSIIFNPSFKFNHKSSHTISYSLQDLAIRNISSNNDPSHGASPAWDFRCQNLPAPSGDKGFDRNCPIIACSTLDRQAIWLWHSNTHAEGDIKSIGKIVTEITPTLGAVHNGLCVKGEHNTLVLPSIVLKTDMVVPCRTAFGTVSLDNTYSNREIISNVQVISIPKVSTEQPKVVFKSSGDFGPSSSCTFSVAEGKYNITMDLISRDGVVKKYELKSPYEVARRKNKDNLQHLDAEIRFKEVQ